MAFPFTGRIEVGWLFIAEMTYVYYLVLKLKKGLSRLLALLPLVLLSLLVVWRAPTAFERTVYCSFFLWMLMFKLVAIAWGKGLAVDSHALSSFPRFVYACQSAVHLPLDPQFVKEADSGNRRRDSEAASSSGRKKSGAGAGTGSVKKRSQSAGVQDADPVEMETIMSTSPNLMQTMVTSQDLHLVILRCLFYYIVTTSLLRMVLMWRDLESEFVLDLMLGFFTYFWFLLFFEVVVVLPASIVGTELKPLFDMPFLADSLGDFWARRWNLLVINLLRVSVYEPMLRILGRRGKKPSIVDRAISAGATFLVSGLMHELALFCASRSKPSWEMTTFFVLNGAGTIVERSVKARHRVLVPRFIRRASTLIFVYFFAHWFFFPPLKRNGLLDGMADLRVSIHGIEKMILLQLQSHQRGHARSNVN